MAVALLEVDDAGESASSEHAAARSEKAAREAKTMRDGFIGQEGSHAATRPGNLHSPQRARAATMAVCRSQTNLFGELDAECQVKLPCALPPLGSSAEMHVATRGCGGVSSVGTGMSRY